MKARHGEDQHTGDRQPGRGDSTTRCNMGTGADQRPRQTPAPTARRVVLIGHETAHVIPLVSRLINQQLHHGRDEHCANDGCSADLPGSQQTKGVGQHDDPALEQILRPWQEKIPGKPRLRRGQLVLPPTLDLYDRHAPDFPRCPCGQTRTRPGCLRFRKTTPTRPFSQLFGPPIPG